MSILDKVMFWKKKDEFGDIGLGDKDPLGKGNLAFGDDFGMGSAPGYGQQSKAPEQPSFAQQPSFSQSSFAQQQFPQQQQPYQQPRYEPQQDVTSKNLEIISSKLDALRASIESLNQRLANLEAIARGEEEQRRRRYY
jgi:hypothetical protein|tara:strand:- start:139 stop:552 length:414 start_codon:yes stop_codon:yes gene_type:complete